MRQSRRASDDGAGQQREKERMLETLEAVLVECRRIEREAAERDGAWIRDAIGTLAAGDLFDLTSRSDDFALLVGFESFARVWEGIATGERLLMRCWSMCTDGHAEEGREELPHVVTAFTSSAEALRAL